MAKNLDSLGLSGVVVDGKYRIDQAVGEGGFSVVYRAQHLIWNEPVAIKCFKVVANAPEEQRQQLIDGFLQEGRLMSTLSSRSAAIVQARDVGTLVTPGGVWVPYMVLEWLQGQPLDVVLRDENRRGLPARTIQEVMMLLEAGAIAVDLAHSMNVAHRDIKPANFFIIGDPRGVAPTVKVLDFGIAKVMAEHAQLATALSHTGKDVTAFTPNYGAPEQFSRSHGATGPWTDVFAMALVLVELLRGGVPALSGDDYLQLAVASRDPQVRPSPRTLGVFVTDPVEAVFQRALAVSPADRYPTLGMFWAALYQAVFPGSAAWSPGLGVGSTGPHSALPTVARASRSGATPVGGPMSASGHSAGGPPSTAIGLSSSQLTAGGSGASRWLVPAALLGLAAIGGGGAALYFLRSADAGGGESAGEATEASAVPAASEAVAAPPPLCPPGMAHIEEAKFFRGSDEDGFELWKPSHKVVLSPYCIDEREVTARAYKECSDRGDCKRPGRVPDYPKSQGKSDEDHDRIRNVYAELCNFGVAGREEHPINCVTWEMADLYCKAVGKRLPTEAEWEFAARGSDGRKFPWGDDPGDEQHMNACGSECTAWEKERGLEPSHQMYDASDGYAGTAPVGSFPKGKTKFGLDDMVGNVWEWTGDWFETYKPGEVKDPKGAAAGDRKAIRGGGFNGGVQLWLNPAFRYHQLATASSHGIGFRCAKSAGP